MENNKNNRLNLLSAKIFEKDENEIVERYVECLKKLEKDDNAKNIAVSGSYGSGKSSIIKTYFSRQKHRRLKPQKYLTVSIGSFLEEERQSSNESKAGEKNKTPNMENDKKEDSSGKDGIINIDEERLVEKIEKSIVRQLIYKNSANEMEQSELKRVNDKKNNRIFNLLLLFVILIPSIGILNNYILDKYSINLVDLIINNSFLSNNIKLFGFIYRLYDILFIFCIILYSFSSLIVLYKIINKVSTFKPNKIKIDKYEYETSLNEKMPFSVYLNEIIYFFYMNGVEVVCFEDIDRFPEDVSLKVAEELKELNEILNNSFFLGKKHLYSKFVNCFKRKKIMFIYSFKDSIFKNNTDRTKFYDYILSVMPISSNYNSVVNFKMELKKYNILEEIPDELIEKVSKYIFDMRTIKAIVNDYLLLRDIHNVQVNGELTKKIFGMCVFKNYYNREYDELSNYDNSKNIILEKFEKCKDYRKQEKKKYEEEKNKNNAMIEKLNEWNKSSIKTLKDALWYRNVKNVNGSNHFLIINSNRITYDEYTKDDFDINMIDENTIMQSNSGYSGNFSFESFGGKKFFLELMQNDKSIEKYRLLNQELDSAKNNIDTMCDNDIYMLISKKYDNFDLLDTLISLKAICNDDYIDYVTAPSINENLSQNDCRFIFNVLHNNSNIDTELNHVDVVIEMLKGQLKNKYILNCSLVKYLIDNKIDDNLNIICDEFKFDNEIYDVFLNKLYDYDFDTFKKFINKIYLYNNDFFDIVIENKLTSEKVRTIISYGLLFIPQLKIKNMTQFCNYISKAAKQNVEVIFNDSVCKNNINELNVRFNNISEEYDKYKTYIIENNCYSFSKSNILQLFEINNWENLFDSINSNNNGSLLLDYIYNSINYFFSELYIKNENIVINNNGFTKKLFFNNNLLSEYRIEIVKREKIKLSKTNIKLIPSDVALKYNVLIPTWNNLNDIYNSQNKIFMYDFIMNNQGLLFNENNKTKINSFSSEKMDYLISEILKNQNDELLKKILDNYTNQLIQIEFNDSYSLKLTEILIDHQMIVFDEKNYKHLPKTIDIQYNYLKDWYANSDVKTKPINRIKPIEELYDKIIKESDNNDLKLDLMMSLNRKDDLYKVLKEGSIRVSNLPKYKSFLRKINFIEISEIDDYLVIKLINNKNII